MSNSGNIQKKIFTLSEMLDNIDFFTDDDGGPTKSELFIFICPPDEERGELTEEDWEGEEATNSDVSHLGRNLLNTKVEPP